MPEESSHVGIEVLENPQIGTHEKNRKHLAGSILNLGPSQTYTSPLTHETINQHFANGDFKENPGSYIIPGFYPQGDLISVFTTVAAPFLGVADGAAHHDTSKYIKEIEREFEHKRMFDLKYNSAFLDYLGKYESLQSLRESRERPKIEEGKPTLTEGDLRKLYGDRVVVNVSGKRNKVMIPTNYSADFEIGGSNYGNLDANFPEKIGKGGTAGKGGKSGFIDDVEFGEGSVGRYVFEVTGPVKGARVKREHNC